MTLGNLVPREFYVGDTVEIARRALGKVVVRETDAGSISGRIVETEAYTIDDPASHAFRGMTLRNAVMFGEPGHAYVYFSYGAHFMLNLVTQEAGVGEAVLVRALEPVDGIELMRANREVPESVPDFQLCAGPGRLTKALAIDRPTFDGTDLTSRHSKLYLLDAPVIPPDEIVTTTRVGITKAIDRPWRFYVKNCKSVSRK